jgi:peptidoglycan/LPS O-acetylase OafA/YrhL
MALAANGVLDVSEPAPGTTLPERTRSAEITVFETLLCLFVVFVHVASRFISGSYPDSVFVRTVYLCRRFLSFSMTGFIFMSALKQTIKYRDGRMDYKRFLLVRLRRVYLPYAAWVVVYYAYFVWLAGYFPFDAGDLAVYILSGTLVAHFYFIIIIMQFYLLTPVLLSLAKRAKPALTLAGALAVTAAALPLRALAPGVLSPINGDYLFPSYLIFWMLGVCCGLHFDAFIALTRRRAARFLIAFAVVGIPHLALSYLGFTGRISYTAGEYVQIFYRITAIPAFFALLALLKPLPRRVSRAFEFLHRFTFPVYLSHILAIYVVLSALHRLLPEAKPSALFVLTALFAYAAPFIGSWLYSRLYSRGKGVLSQWNR